MGCPKWKHGPKSAVCPCCLILSHTHAGEFGDAKLDAGDALGWDAGEVGEDEGMLGRKATDVGCPI